MTQEELDQLAQQVTDKIQNKSSDPSQFELATSLQGIESLPVLHQSGGTWTLKRVLISLLKGSDGKQIELQVTATAIQWRYAGGAWVDLILLSTLLDPATDLMAELQEVIDLWNGTIKGEVSTAISNANTSASNADSKAGLANTAATNANTAASEANTAKEGVMDAIDNANDTAEHPTYIGTDFYVYKWNKTTKVYEKTDIFVKGSAGAGNVDIINSSTVKKDVPYVIVPTANAAQTYNAVEAGTLNVDWKAKQMITSNGVISQAGLINSDVLAWGTNASPSTGALVVVFPNNVVDTGTVLQFDLNLVTTAIATTFQRSLTLHGWITHAVGNDFYGNLTGNLIFPIKTGIIDGKTCIIIGNSDTAFQAPKVYLSVRTGRTGTDLWKTGYSVQQLTDLSNVTILKDLSVVSRTVTQSELDAKASTTQLNSAISDFNTRFAGQYEIVSVRPAVGVEGKMYLVTTGTSNVYNLFTWKSVSGVFDWVDLGSTTVDLSQYAKSADVTSALSNKVDKVSGKGLSTNDFTDDEKSEVAKIANKADLGEDGKVLPSQLPAMSEGSGKPQEIKLLLSDAMPTCTYDGNYGFVWSLSADGDSFVENCRFSLSCGYDATPPSVWSIYVANDGIAYLHVSFVGVPFTEYLILDRYTGFSNSAAPISDSFYYELWSNTHIAQNTGGVDASIGGMFTLTASGALNVSFINLYYIPLGKSLRIRIKGNNSTNRTITITPDGVTNELDNTSYQVNNVKTLELDIVNFGGEFIMKGVLYE